MPVTIEEVSVETMPETPAPAGTGRQESGAGSAGEQLQPSDLPQHLAKLRDRDERVHAH